MIHLTVCSEMNAAIAYFNLFFCFFVVARFEIKTTRE